jgi:ABC-2 type transport system ATP-binding protein
MIAVQNLKKHFTVYEKDPGFLGSVRSFLHRKTRVVAAVDGISFNIESGEMIGFLGPNGAGKTTTLKMLSGILHPTSGLVRVGQFTPTDRRKDFLKMITLIMGQKQQLLWDLPALDSFRVNQAIYEIPDSTYQAALKEFTEILDLGDILKRQVRQLSLGERMKCELAAALLHRPQVLFLDEPTIGLDINMQTCIREFIDHYNRKHNATVILTSHYMADVLALCKRIVVIDKGNLIFDGDLSHLINSIATSKIIRLELASAVPTADLERYGQVKQVDGLQIEIAVPRAKTSEIAMHLLNQLPLTDLTIIDPPIEEIIAAVFAGEHKEAAVAVS